MRVLVEILDHHGRARWREHLAPEGEQARFTVGRGAAADVVVDDPHAAALHAAVEVDAAGRVCVTDLGSLNGITVGGRRLRGAHAVELGDGLFTVGRTRLRVRTPAEAIAPELPEREGLRAGVNAVLLSLASAAVCIGFVAYSVWLSAPQDMAGAMATALIYALLLAGAWVAAWGFVTRVMQSEWRWALHAAILFTVLGAVVFVDWLFDVLWFALSLPGWPSQQTALLVAAAVLGLHWHLRSASNISRRRAALVAVALPLAVGGGFYFVNAIAQARNVNYIGVELKVFPPSWRLRPGGSLDAYFADAARLKDQTDRKRKAMRGEDDEDSGADED